MQTQCQHVYAHRENCYIDALHREENKHFVVTLVASKNYLTSNAQNEPKTVEFIQSSFRQKGSIYDLCH